MKTEIKFPADLHDKYGNPIHEDDVIYDGKNHFVIYWNKLHPQVEAYSPTFGYMHDLSQSDLNHFVRCGTMKEIETFCDERL